MLKKQLKNILWLLKVSWTKCSSDLLVWTFLSLIGALMPFFMLIALQNTIDTITLFINKGYMVFDKAIVSITLYALFMFIQAFYNSLPPFIFQKMQHNTLQEFKKIIAAKVLNTNILAFDSAEYQERLSLANQAIDYGPVMIILQSSVEFICTLIEIGSVSYIVARATPLGLLALIMITLLNIWIQAQNGKQQYNLEKENEYNRRKSSYYASLLTDKNNAMEIRAYGLGDYFIQRWQKITEIINASHFKVRKKWTLVFILVSSLRLLIMGLSTLFVAINVFNGELSLGQLLTIWVAFGMIQSSLERWASVGAGIVEAVLMASELQNFLEWEPIKSFRSTTGLITDYNSGSNKNIPLMELKDVSFSYKGDKPNICHVSAKINQGDIIALVGYNGSGKTTLIKLLLGLYEPDDGVILREGIPLSDFKLDTSNIGCVFQDYVRYEMKLRENVGFGCLKYLNEDPVLERALYKAGAKDIYKNDLNDSMDSILGRSFDISGVELSGGQWQKLAIARGLVGNPLFVVFDEPTSNLDPIAEYEQFVQIKEQLHGETILIVSHRLGLSRLANRIWVLKDGQLIEDGSHYELLSKNQEYARLWENQIKWYDLDLISKGGF